MPSLFRNYTYCLILVFACVSCSTGKFSTDKQSHMSAEAKKLQFVQGDILPNASFEKKAEVKIPGWYGAGCELAKDDARSGQGSLALTAEAHAQAVCYSEKVAILPGHYDFSVWLKTAGLGLNEKRKLRTALSLRLHLFDGRGRLINQNVSYRSHTLDSSLVNYGLFGITEDRLVDELGYTQIKLVPYNYPFDYGWVSKTAAYAQVAVVLTGPGTIWLDDFSLAFSKWNFGLQERIELLTKAHDPYAIFPPPQQISFAPVPWTVDPAQGQSLCLIQKGRNTRYAPAVSIALRALKDKLEYFGVSKGALNGECRDAMQMLIVGRKNLPTKLLRDFSLRKKLTKLTSPEHYLIEPVVFNDGRQGLVLLGGGARGLYYALQTLNQLIQRNSDGKIEVRTASVLDYPAFSVRAVSAKDPRGRSYRQEVEAPSWLPEARLNTLFLEGDPHNLKWWQPQDDLLDAARRIGIEQDRYGLVQLGLMLNPYVHRYTDTIEKEIEFSGPSTLNETWDVVRAFAERGAKHIMLRADDLVPHVPEDKFGYYLDNERDQARFGNLANVHAFWIRAIHKKLKREFPDTALYFVPPWYTNNFVDLSPQRGKSYLAELATLISEEIPLLWTGAGVRSTFIDEVHIKRFSEWIGGREPMLWDNTLYARRHKWFWKNKPDRVELNSYFEPYDVAWPPKLFEAGRYNKNVFINADVTEMYRIQLATVGAYLWNPGAYQPEKALWGYLKLRFGSDNATLLLEYDSILWQLRRLSLACEDDNEQEHACRRNRIDKNVLLDRMLIVLAKLQGGLAQQGGDLLDELREYYLKEAAANAPTS
ncbi:glycoside hydrolase family 20 zincin-like fold domain-containing protein [Oligoflexia bacterium]|nr:glycoside hydrolase family 20 zincin-like fold domain-containing protein [Oligoflexia bacterium]